MYMWGTCRKTSIPGTDRLDLLAGSKELEAQVMSDLGAYRTDSIELTKLSEAGDPLAATLMTLVVGTGMKAERILQSVASHMHEKMFDIVEAHKQALEPHHLGGIDGSAYYGLDHPEPPQRDTFT